MSLNKLLIATTLMVSVSGLALADSTMPAAGTPATTTPASTSAPAKVTKADKAGGEKTAAEKAPLKKHAKHAHRGSRKGPKLAKAEKPASNPKAEMSAAPAAK